MYYLAKTNLVAHKIVTLWPYLCYACLVENFFIFFINFGCFFKVLEVKTVTKLVGGIKTKFQLASMHPKTEIEVFGY